MGAMKRKLEEFIEQGGIETDYAGFAEWLDANVKVTDEDLDRMAMIEEKLKSNKESIETLKSAQGVSHEKQLQSR